MKITTLFLLLVSIGSLSSAFGQEFEKPAEGKSLVYFVRLSGMGALINFKYFDGDKYLGKINGSNYFIYECDPGEHIFWVAAENRDFIKGELKPNSTYVIEVRPTVGAFTSAVRLHPVAPDDEKALKRVKKMLSKKSPKELNGQDEDMDFFIKNGMDRYKKIESKVEVINSGYTF